MGFGDVVFGPKRRSCDLSMGYPSTVSAATVKLTKELALLSSECCPPCSRPTQNSVADRGLRK